MKAKVIIFIISIFLLSACVNETKTKIELLYSYKPKLLDPKSKGLSVEEFADYINELNAERANYNLIYAKYIEQDPKLKDLFLKIHLELLEENKIAVDDSIILADINFQSNKFKEKLQKKYPNINLYFRNSHLTPYSSRYSK